MGGHGASANADASNPAWILYITALIATCAVAFIPTSILPYVPFSKHKVQRWLVAFTVGILFADVFLLIIPHLLHLHHGSHTSHSEPPPPPEPTKKNPFARFVKKLQNLQKKADEATPTFAVTAPEEGAADDPFLLVVMAGFFFFFLVERFLQVAEGKKTGHSQAHACTEATKSVEPEKKETCGAHSAACTSEDSVDKTAPPTDNAHEKCGQHEGNDHHHAHDHGDHEHEHHSLSTACKLNLIMDVVHNTSDGLRLGVAFLSSMAGGLALSAVSLLHEMMHELGDTTTLVQGGQSPIHAIHFQHKTAAALFLGCAAGITSERYLPAADYIMAVAAGGYLYVALVKMLPKLLEYQHPCFSEGVFEGIALLLGFIAMKFIVDLETLGLVPLIGYADILIQKVKDFVVR